ncbi:GAF and ANTAR domain-containing protein [Mycolicibacterium arenosum]|uniref:ANTAR domain-containing protein n=1 Tax=Mycolicibacterium arenosum TaxID=2952157 RepID=A0ABT1MCB5_9MYCO|nr:GAF and ANTAR domain-containing protein [Mycolicibacterium sp. CAU 1645]MCP9275834.1 ANTAR domain-containing protein [Mycolicibacterium sp. CAU 1645]
MSAISGKFMAALAGYPDGSLTADAVSVCCVAVLPVDSAAIGVSAPSSTWEPLGASDETATRLQAQQILAGEGPAFDALAHCVPVLVGDVSAEFDRWPGFVTALDGYARGALFAFPLLIGAISVGVLELSRNEPVPLERAEVADVVAVADIVTTILLTRSEPVDGDPPGGEAWWAPSPSSVEIHQATGMVVAQLSVSPRIAYLRLRAHAFATDRPLHEVARAVIDRRLRFDSDNES